jgi:tRNA pseudouridine55 synthase
MNNGILLLNKPGGPSSAKVLGPLKRTFSTRKIGHTGTLDPFASGLLVIMVGTATRLASLFTKLDKQYTALVRFGVETDTLDPEGTIVIRRPLPDPEEIKRVLPGFVGRIEQTPPAFSAVHVGGERAYERARRGEQVEIAPRIVEVQDIVLQPETADRYRMEVSCGSGTYIRSLARDIARAAGSAASLETLERTAVGPFHLMEADPENQQLIDIPTALRRLGGISEVELTEEQDQLVQQGRQLSTSLLDSVLNSLNRPQRESGQVALLLKPDGGESALCELTPRGWTYRAVFSR